MHFQDPWAQTAHDELKRVSSKEYRRMKEAGTLERFCQLKAKHAHEDYETYLSQGMQEADAEFQATAENLYQE